MLADSVTGIECALLTYAYKTVKAGMAVRFLASHRIRHAVVSTNKFYRMRHAVASTNKFYRMRHAVASTNKFYRIRHAVVSTNTFLSHPSCSSIYKHVFIASVMQQYRHARFKAF
jgi:hypothetical protein